MARQCSQPADRRVEVEGVLECRDDPVELAFEEWRNTPQPNHDLAAPHDVGAPSPDSPRPRKIGSRLPFRKLCAGRPLMPSRGNGGTLAAKSLSDPIERFDVPSSVTPGPAAWR